MAPASSAQTFVGTEGFVPPEGPGSPSADVFALGKVLYELSTGLDRQDFPQLPSDLSRLPDHRALLALNEVILRACEAAPEKRYRDATALLADLERLQAGQPVRRAARWPLAAAAAALVVLGAGAYFLTRKAPAPPAPPSVAAATTPVPLSDKAIAVLPFINLSGDTAQEYFSDAITVEILSALRRERDFTVPGDTSCFAFKGRGATAAEIAKALNVSRFVEGSVRKDGNQVRISVTLTRAADGVGEELGTFTEELKEIFALQDKVARAVVTKITRRPPTSTVAVLTKNPEAYDFFLRARVLQTRSANGTTEAAKLYEKAVAADPSFALAWAWLAYARFRDHTGGSNHGSALVDPVKQAIDRALQAQPDLPEALIVRAMWLRAAKEDYAAAARDLARVEALQAPTAELRQGQALLARELGNWPEAFRLLREEAALDPQNGDYANADGLTNAVRGRYAEADRLFQRAMTIQGPSISLPFRNRVNLRARWRGGAAALRLLERAPAGYEADEILRVNLLLEAGRVAEARARVDQFDRFLGGANLPAGTRNFRFLPDQLMAVGLDDLARQRAAENRAVHLKAFEQGDRTPGRYQKLVMLSTVMGERDAALAFMETWRSVTQSSKSDWQRIIGFHESAAGCYARLGRVDEALALLREARSLGFHLPTLLQEFKLRASDPLDPRIEQFFSEEAAWAATLPDPEEDAVVSPAAPAVVLPGRKATSTDQPRGSARAPAVDPEKKKSIAVLPFENLSTEADNAVFADGVHEDVLTNLALIRGLHVISRTSVQQYRATRKTIRQIGEELGASYLLEGSVRRAGNSVRVTGQLIDARTDEHVWAKTYTKELKDVFALQSELAEAIATALSAALSPQEKSRVEKPPTDNLPAYEKFLAARAEDRRSIKADPVKIRALLREVVQLDPKFVKAWSYLVRNLAWAYFNGPVAERFNKDLFAEAKSAVETVLRFAPDDPDAMLADGVFHYYCQFDYAGAAEIYRRVLEISPNSADVAEQLGFIYRRLGRPVEALALLRQAGRLDPQNSNTAVETGKMLAGIHRYEEAAAEFRRAAAIEPQVAQFWYQALLMPFLASGSTREMDDWLVNQKTFPPDNRDVLNLQRAWLRQKGDHRGAIEFDRQHPVPERKGARGGGVPLGEIFELVALGDLAGAKARAAGVLPEIESQLAAGKRTPDGPTAGYSRLQDVAWVYAIAGDRDTARRYADQMVEAMNEKKDAWTGAGVQYSHAQILAWTGDKERSLAELARLLRTPFGGHVHAIRHSPAWQPLRDDPRFKALLDDPKNNAPLF
ncbi:MAG: tetratricopeptide repeat protein [Verrucomicrobia bacterium]|nr:tetratricopeptide repeat protein [Verrucomicrobiota bacterium]